MDSLTDTFKGLNRQLMNEKIASSCIVMLLEAEQDILISDGIFINFEPAHNKTNKMMCAHRRLRSAFTSAQSDQSAGCRHRITRNV